MSFSVPFLPRDAMHKRGLCRRAVSVCLAVCLPVRPSITFVYSVDTNKRRPIYKIFHRRIVFRTKPYGNIQTGTP